MSPERVEGGGCEVQHSQTQSMVIKRPLALTLCEVGPLSPERVEGSIPGGCTPPLQVFYASGTMFSRSAP
ncbi:MAG: hypothetical protein AAGF95_31810 [Chloroflexota bacterium]